VDSWTSVDVCYVSYRSNESTNIGVDFRPQDRQRAGFVLPQHSFMTEYYDDDDDDDDNNNKQ